MRKMISLLLAACTCFSASLNAQDKLYTKDGVRDGVVTEITDTEVKFTSAGSSQSVPRSDVRLMFRKSGEFLSSYSFKKAADPALLIENFIRPAMLRSFKSDRIYTVFSKAIVASVYNEDDTYIYYKNDKEDDRLPKTSIAAIIYADGKHKVFNSVSDAAEALAETPQIVTGYTETKINYPAVKKPVTTPVQQKNEPVKTLQTQTDNTVEKTKPAKSTATLMILSNKGATISAVLNGENIANIKPGDFKRVELPVGNHKLILDDKQGNVVEKNLVVDNTLKAQNVFFPEIDYAAAQRKQKENEKAIEDQKKADAQALSDKQKAADKLIADEAAAKADQVKKENELKLNEASAKLKLMQQAILKEQQNTATAREAYLADSIKIVKGTKEVDEATYKILEAYETSKKQTDVLLAEYNEYASAPDVKELARPFLTQAVKNSLRFGTISFIDEVKAGKRPMSNSLAVALQKSRAGDLKFFIKKEDIESLMIDGQNALYFALKQKGSGAVIQALINIGYQVNIFSKRLPNNFRIYESPLAVAAASKNTDAIKILLENGAKLYPPNAMNIDKRNQVQYIRTLLKDDAETVSLFEKAGIPLPNYEALLKKALDDLSANMVTVETGSFTIGCIPDVKTTCLASESPAAEIKMNKFKIAKFEITRAQWAAIMEDDEVEGLNKCSDCPVSKIDHEMATNFILKLNQMTKKKFRLPTEAEWEFAAAGGAPSGKTKYSGNEESSDVAWTSENSNGAPHPVGQKKPNALGLYDMSGNVAEWTNSWYVENYYMQIPKENPKGPEAGTTKVLRGGSYLQSNFSARVTRRWGENVQFLNPGVGFRLAMDAD